jgi:hypothetical protein
MLALSFSAFDPFRKSRMMRPRHRLRLRAAITVEVRPDASEGAQRAVVVEREPDDILFFRLRVRLRRVLGEAVDRDKAAVLRLQPAAPVRSRIPITASRQLTPRAPSRSWCLTWWCRRQSRARGVRLWYPISTPCSTRCEGKVDLNAPRRSRHCEERQRRLVRRS